MSLTEMKLESNSKIRIDFGGGNLSSDGGLLLMKEFLSKIGFERLAATKFKTTDRAKRLAVLFLAFVLFSFQNRGMMEPQSGKDREREGEERCT